MTRPPIARPVECRRRSLHVPVAIVDTGGDLVYFEWSDHTQVGSVDVAIEKARRPYGMSANVWVVDPGRNGVARPSTHAGWELA